MEIKVETFPEYSTNVFISTPDDEEPTWGETLCVKSAEEMKELIGQLRLAAARMGWKL